MRIGCLGAARITPEVIVHPARVRGDIDLVAVASRDQERSCAFASTHGFAEALTSYAELVEHPNIDLVYNALPISLHAEWTIRALEAGKDVLCEKPFAMNVGEARGMLDVANQHGRRVVEAMHYRYHPAFATFLDWIQTGKVGRLRSIDSELSVAIPDREGTEIRHLPETGGGAFMDLGCYPLHWVLSILEDDPVSIRAHASTTVRGVDDCMTVELRFAGDVTARLKSSMTAAIPTRNYIEVTGDEGKIRFENPCIPHRGYELTATRGARVEPAATDQVTTYFYQLKSVVENLRAGVPLLTEGKCIIRQQTFIDEIYTAAGLRHLRYQRG